MKPNTELGGLFNTDNPAVDIRMTDLHASLDKVRDTLSNQKPLATEPLIAGQLARGDFKVGEGLESVIFSGIVEKAYLTQPYDLQRYPHDPTIVTASQLLHFTVDPKPKTPIVKLLAGSKKGMTKPSTEYFMPILRLDSTSHHVEEETETHTTTLGMAEDADKQEDKQDVKEVLDQTLKLNQERFTREPALTNYGLGIARRAGDIQLFRIAPNPRFGKVIAMLVGEGSPFSSIENPRTEIGTVDNDVNELRYVSGSDILVLELKDELELAYKSMNTPKAQKRFLGTRKS